jgi:hypothetical protein
MYFTDSGDNAIGRVSMSGEVTEFPIPGIAAVGPDEIIALGNELVFDELSTAALGTVNPTATPGEAPLATPPAMSAIAASLTAQLKSAEALAKTTFRSSRRRFSLTFMPPEAGSVAFTWTAEPHVALHKATKRVVRPVVVATGKETFDLPEPRMMSVQLTPAGVRLLKRSPRRARLKLTVQLAFSGLTAGPIEFSTHQQVVR